MMELNAIILLVLSNFCFLQLAVGAYTMKVREDLSLLYTCVGVSSIEMFYCSFLNGALGLNILTF